MATGGEQRSLAPRRPLSSRASFALGRTPPSFPSVLVDGFRKGHGEHDPSRLIGDLEGALEPVSDAAHAPVRDEVSGRVQRMPMHRMLMGEFIPLLVHEQAVTVAQVHVETSHPHHACPITLAYSASEAP